MSFTPPTFNIAFSAWFASSAPWTGPPDWTSMGQLYTWSRHVVGFGEVLGSVFYPIIQIRIPYSAVIAEGSAIPMVQGIFRWTDEFGQIWTYKCQAWEYMHKNFPNEYVTFWCIQCQYDGNIPDINRGPV